MNNDYTIIIPTYNHRHKYLNRILDYLSPFNLNIIVTDSSKNQFNESKDYDIDYLHLPDVNYNQKLHIALKKVKTSFVILCADDDFIIPTAINTCVQFLNKNESYASVQGNIIAFKNRKWKLISTFPWMFHTYNLDFNSKLPTDRLTSLFNHHIYLYYSLHRKENLITTFSLTKEFDDNFAGSTAEYFLNIISIINGKHKVLPIFYSVSELAKTSSRSMYMSMDQIKGKAEFKRLIEFIGTYLSEVNQMSKDEAVRFIKDIFDSSWYFSKRTTIKAESSHPLQNMGVIKKFVDELSFLNPLKTAYSNLYYYIDNQKREREYKKQVQKTRELRGFPYYEKEAREEWIRIKKKIKKHGVIRPVFH